MSEISISSSSNSIEKVIDEYYDDSSDNSSDSSSHSNEGSSSDEGYSSGVPGLPLEVVKEQLRKAFGFQAGVSSSVPLDEEETIYSCAVGIHSKTNEQRLSNLRTWYQIPDEFNPRLPVHGE